MRRNRMGRLVLDARSEGWCRAQYERWLELRGRQLFGAPLDHGDDPGAPAFEAEAGEDPGRAEAPVATDQGTADGKALSRQQAQQPVAPKLAPARREGSAPPDRETPEREQTVWGRLRAVSDGSPGEPSATALDRKAIAHWRQVGGYKDETVAALAALACGERIIERLSHRQVKRVSWLLECAVRGRVTQRTLAGGLTRLSKRDDREPAASQVEAWLRQKADEVGLLGRREAA